MSNVQNESKHVVFDLRERILTGEHPRNEMFEYMKQAPVGTVALIHTPRRPNPLIKGLEQLGMKVTVDEVEPGNFRVTTEKLNEI